MAFMTGDLAGICNGFCEGVFRDFDRLFIRVWKQFGLNPKPLKP